MLSEGKNAAIETEDKRPSDIPVIRLGLIGVGKIALDQHIPALRADPRFEIVATASHHGSLPDIPTFDALDSLLDAGIAFDAVSICTPPKHRHALASAALRAGKHVMLEKPPGTSIEEVEDLALCAMRARRTLFTTWHSRESSCVDSARTWLAARRIQRVTITWQEDIRVWHPGQHWILDADGFGVFDPGINALSILSHLLPDALVVRAATLHVPENKHSPIAAHLALGCENSTVAVTLDFLYPGPPRWDIEIETDGGLLALREGGQRMEINGELSEVSRNREYARLYSRFAALISECACDVDTAPLRLATDALARGRRVAAPAFDF